MIVKQANLLLKGLAFSAFLLFLFQCKTEPKHSWSTVNDQLIKEHKLTVREISGLPEQKIESNIEAAHVKNIQSFPAVKLTDRVSSKMF